ncbi:MAG: PhzF family phenazine biosynthesis protein [Cyanobacteria bacterium P01_A01_bin.45]
MTQQIIQVDAFTNQPFKGNPAAVCILDAPLDEEWMQNVALEMNLSETAFLLKQEDGFNLRWFTPTQEVPLCGHATLASSHVLFLGGFLKTDETARFHTKSGLLTAEKKGEWIELNFPANFSEIMETPLKLSTALGIAGNKIKTVAKNSLGYLVEVDSEELVRNMQPNFTLLKDLFPQVIVTSPGKDNSAYDFVSRFFAPGLGVNEDPVTGAAHCCLAPFWRKKLGKDDFIGYQASSRGGFVKINYDGGERVYLQGQAVSVMQGEIL